MVVNDTICAAGHFHQDLYYDGRQGPPACVTCGEATQVSFLSGQAPAITGFKFQKEAEHLRRLRQLHPDKKFQLVSDSPAQRARRADDRGQRVAEYRESQGIDARAAQEKHTSWLRQNVAAAQRRGNLQDVAVAQRTLASNQNSLEKRS